MPALSLENNKKNIDNNDNINKGINNEAFKTSRPNDDINSGKEISV